MDTDTTLVVGMVLAVLSIPAMVAAFSEGRTPRAAAIVAIAAGGLMVWAINRQADTGAPYALGDLPGVIYGVIGGFF